MYVDSIIIAGGELIAGKCLLSDLVKHSFHSGSPGIPFNGNIEIILTNTGPINIALPSGFPQVRPREINVLGGLDLHGLSHSVVWTRLARTAQSRDSVLILRDAIDWNVGDEIVITTTDTNIAHTERHRIASVLNRTAIQTVTSLAHTHRVIKRVLANGREVDVAAAVGLLTRNVRVISDNPASSLSGSRVVIHGSIYGYNKGYARLSNTQFVGFGRFDDSASDEQSGIYMNRLYDPHYLWPTYIDACSFDGGFNAA
jgi:hypothetical protein